jgi:shikimate dehydrogenase
MGAKKVVVISRSGTENYENITKHSDAIVIVNTTPVGMYPNNGVSPLADLDIFPKCQAVIDLIYNPPRTKLLMQAEERGIIFIDGLAMLVAQAKKSAEQFTRSSIPDEKIEIIASKIALLTRNIILIGMPGCGKSSIGAELAKIMGREFADTDKWVENKAGKPIPSIFAEDGEEAFRKMENEALEALCKQNGLIIATGGGIVKRHENRNILRQNGIVIYLDRDISELSISGRPLSQSTGIAALAAERLPLYSKWSDYTVAVRGVEQTAADIYERYQGGTFS